VTTVITGCRGLIFGGMGQAGQGLVRQVEDGTVLALSREDADLTDTDAVKAALDKYDPTVN